jgi:hypothetical protein
MNARTSAFAIGRLASRYGASSTRCRGRSLSNAKPVSGAPISTMPPS